MKKLWQKNWELNSIIERFETNGDLLLDQQLVTHDVAASIAHAQTLHKSNILTAEETNQLIHGLHGILEQNNNGQFQLQPGDEDVHTKIEQHLTATLGEVGKKIHTGRSRNDQVLVALRLFTKEQLLAIWQETITLAGLLTDFAEQHEQVLMPGYTHMQRAMPSTVGMWAGAIAEGLRDDLIMLKAAYAMNNQSPLGSAAGYGVPLNIDREYTAELLGFERVQSNSVYCQNSRGKIEATILAATIAILQDINKFATDILLFTTTEFGFFDIAPELCSGSSIMPQKKNVDIAELLRSKVHLVLGNYTQLVSLSSNLISGYNRDVQDTKKPLFDSLHITKDSLVVSQLLVKGISINKKNIKKAITPEIFATHYALSLVNEGIPFREAYQKAAQEYQKVSFSEEVIKESTHIGGIGNLGTNALKKSLDEEDKLCQKEKNSFAKTLALLYSQ